MRGCGEAAYPAEAKKCATRALPGNAPHGAHGCRCGAMETMRASTRGSPTIIGARCGQWGTMRRCPHCPAALSHAVHGMTGHQIQRIRERFLLRNHIFSGHGGMCAKRSVFVLVRWYIRTLVHRCLCVKRRAPMSMTICYPLFVTAPGCLLLIAYCPDAGGPGSRQCWPGH